MLKKSLLLLLFALSFAGLSFTNKLDASTLLLRDEDNELEIPLMPRQSGSHNPPRAPSSFKIKAYYDKHQCLLYAFLTNAEETVNVEINNVLTGEHYSFAIPGEGASVMDIGDNTGCWTVLFELSSGDEYYGFFVL